MNQIQESLIEVEKICKLLNDRELAILTTKVDPNHLSNQKKRPDIIKDLLSHCAYLLNQSLADIVAIPQGQRLVFIIEQTLNGDKKGKDQILEVAIMMANHIRGKIQKVEKLDDPDQYELDLCPNCGLPVTRRHTSCPRCSIPFDFNTPLSEEIDGFELDL